MANRPRDPDHDIPLLTDRIPGEQRPRGAAAPGSDDDLPHLTEVAARDIPEDGAASGSGRAHGAVGEVQLARLHSELTAATFELTEELLRAAWSSAEARLFAQVLERLRQELPELVEQVVREHLGPPPEDGGDPDAS